jgi:hypothetical protein
MNDSISTKRKPSVLFALLVLVAANLTGCSKQDGGTPITGRNPQLVGAGSVKTPTGQTIGLNGWIISQSNYQDAFQDAATGFVEADLAPEYLGFVSARGTGGTGIFIGGHVPLQSGLLSPSNNPQVNVRTQSYLLVAIYDEYANRPDSSGRVVGPYAREFTSASGYIQGNRAYLKFTNAMGSVELEGTFDQNTFQGTVNYDNIRRWDGKGEGAAGNLGWFQVPTCQFFQCR